MQQATITISRKESEKIKKSKKTDMGWLEDVSRGIDDILKGKIKEI